MTHKDLPPLLYYYQEHKDQNVSNAIMYGFDIQHWRPVGDAKCYPGEWIHVVNSLQYGAFQILKQCMDEKKNYIFIDNGYILNHLSSEWMKRMYRVVPNAFQHHWTPYVFEPERLRRMHDMEYEQLLGLWNHGYGDHVLLVPQSSWESNKLFGLDRWVHKMHEQIRATGYKGEIRVRQKGYYQRQLEIDLLNAQACVCYTSNVAVDAIRLGVPTFCSVHSAATSVANCFGDFETYVTQLDDIPRAERSEINAEPTRVDWLRALMCGQFTHTELSNGFAKEMVLDEMIRRME